MTNSTLSRLRHFIFDLDGTIYLGKRLFPGVKALLDLLREQGKNFLFLTNNSSRSVNEYVEKLKELGVDIEPSNVLISSEVTADYVKSLNSGARIYLLGTDGFRKELEKRGLKITETDPDYVVLGFDTRLTYEKLMKACLFISEGAEFIASHSDKTCPSEMGPLIDCGSLAAAITTATGVEPKVLGKPNREMVEAALRRLGAKAEDTAIVGDRLYTDVRMGKDFHLTTVLVLTGETEKRMLEKSSLKPDFVFDSVADLKNILCSD